MTPNLMFPDYTNNILGIPQSLLKYYGAAPFHETLAPLDTWLNRAYKNVVLMVFDGMGSDMLSQNLPDGAFLRRHKAADILSVYPCTTTAAINTLESGLSPIEHGWLGWSCYFKEIWKCVDLFSGNETGIAGGLPAAPVHMANTLMPYERILDKIYRADRHPDAVYEVSPFSAYKAAACHEVCTYVKSLCATPGRNFIYAYHFQPDHDMHDYGCYDDRIRYMIAGFNAQIEMLSAALTDTLLIITADHGLRDIQMLCIEDYPAIMECLSLPMSIEPRCLSLFIREDYKNVFVERFTAAFGDQYLLMTKAEALQKGLFGPGTPHRKSLDFLGDYIAVATGGIGLTYKDNKGEYNDFKAAHAGLDAREMTVPLIMVSTPEAKTKEGLCPVQ